VHAFGVWLLRAVAAGMLFLALWMLIANWAVPTLVEGIRP
jgi:hypothetical protein